MDIYPRFAESTYKQILTGLSVRARDGVSDMKRVAHSGV
jgi:hypothetical protein